jgi:hypothetical protein
VGRDGVGRKRRRWAVGSGGRPPVRANPAERATPSACHRVGRDGVGRKRRRWAVGSGGRLPVRANPAERATRRTLSLHRSACLGVSLILPQPALPARHSPAHPLCPGLIP